MLNRIFGNSTPWGHFFLRLAVGAIFIAHGAQKLFGAFGGPGLNGFAGMLARLGFRPAMAWAVLVAVVEFAGGIFLILGVMTRLSALLIGIVMVVAIVLVHLKGGFFSFEFPMVLLAACVSLLLTGGGRAALKK